MKKNIVAKILQIIAHIELTCAVIVSTQYILSSVKFAFYIALIGFITYMVFIGFAEIIILLQKNTDIQKKILEQLEYNDFHQQQAPKSILQDIESNLPKM